MTIIETFIKGKKEDQTLCEDSFCTTPYFAAVIDGSTSKGTRKYMDVSTGRAASLIAKDVIEHLLPQDADLSTLIAILNDTISRRYRELGVLDMVKEEPENRMTCSLVVYSEYRHEIWMIGDCLCMVDGMMHDNPKHIEDVLAEMRSLYYHLGITTSHTTDDPGREYILPFLKAQTQLQNNTSSPYGYGVIDGIGNPLPFCKTINVAGAHEIVLASDGYPRIFPTLAEAENALQRQLAEDAMMVSSFRATKGLMSGQSSFDDRTYVRLKL